MSKKMHALAAAPFVAGAVIIIGNGLLQWLPTLQGVEWAAGAMAVIKIVVEVARYVQANGTDGATQGNQDPPTP